jgi:4-amino-4-deoxy-L-arabinose transferase-like glycosyltransferase
MDRGARRVAIAAVAVWALVACFFRLGEPLVVISNEAREGVYVRAMLRSGDFVAPLVANHVENGEIIPDKPPLFHWVAAAATVLRSLLSGGPAAPGPELSRQFDEWALRFPSALFASVLVISVAVLGAALVGNRGALCAAAVLLTSAQFGYQARFGRVDMTFACFASLAALLAGRALLDPHEVRRVPLVGAAAGLAVLAKGPLGAVLPGLACGSALLVRRARNRAEGVSEEVLWRAALVALVVVALPWYVVAGVARGGAVLRSHVFAENFVQFAGLDGRMNELFYLWPWLLDSFPWNLFAVAGLFEAWRRREPGPRFCALWWISSLAFFQIAAYKRRAYLLPALPAEALLAGWFVDVALMRGRSFASIDPSALVGRLARPALLCLTVAAVGALIAPPLYRLWIGDAALLPLDAALVLGGSTAIMLAALALSRALRAGDRWRALVAVWTGLGFLYAVVVPTGIAVIARRRSTKTLVDRIEAALPEGSRLTLCGIGPDPSLPIIFYFRESDRLEVSPDDTACATDASAGSYLIAEPEWLRMQRSGDERSVWRERLRGELTGWSRRLGVVFAERVASGDSAGVNRLAEK